MLVDLLSYLVITFFAAWAVVTALNQTARTRKWVQPVVSYDICGIVPIWTFFAPHPGNTDVYLLYRDRDEEGHTTHWRDIELERRQSIFSFWNPRRRIGKAVVDLAPDLTANVDYTPRNPVSKRKVLEFPYILLLNYVCHQPLDFRAEMRQFAVARTRGFGTEDDPEIVFLSAFHRLK